jgi:hypothetical protein
MSPQITPFIWLDADPHEIRDKYGVSWQVTPRMLMDLLAGDDVEGRARAFEAMLTMKKLIVADLQSAYDAVV